jgi:hypothetical protein
MFRSWHGAMKPVSWIWLALSQIFRQRGRPQADASLWQTRQALLVCLQQQLFQVQFDAGSIGWPLRRSARARHAFHEWEPARQPTLGSGSQ